jgi:hypothetical protein
MTMKVLYIQVLLEKNEHFSTPVWVFPWELPVFAAAHRKNGVTELKKGVFNKRFAPRADIEYDRIANRYKGPEGSDMTYVSAVYGHGALGIRKLQEAMVEAAKETEAFIIAEAANPAPAEKVNAPEFESPFDVPDELPAGEDVIETQADLREFVGGEAVSIAQ